MSDGGHFIRAFRPSRFSRDDDHNEDVERAKQILMRLYTARAQAGLPLFDLAGGSVSRMGDVMPQA